MIKSSEYKHISASDDLELAVIRIEPEDPERIKGILQLVHGMSEHKERYTDFMRYMAKKGYICVIHDNRGHGSSIKEAGDLGYMYAGGYESLIEDIHEITVETKEYAAKICPDRKLPYTLLGHSMGSLAVRCYIRRYDADIDRLCVLGCPSRLGGMMAGLAAAEALSVLSGEKARSGIMDGIIFGAVDIKRFANEGIENAWLCTDRKVVEEYNKDPLCGFRFTLNGYINLIRLTILTYKSTGFAMNNPSLPIRFYSGSEDVFGISRRDIAKAMRLLKKAGYTDVRGRIYPGMRHEILNETKKKNVYKDIYTFIEGGEV
ncbi:MAG: alpha/beta fold hydrolase [Lachnospiraceae bacterium]|nr:alpha/beta fold hydrolase [Lachnospiraceae bacterium]